MREGLQIIDSDRHLIEPFAMWRRYLDPRFADRAPYQEPYVFDETMVARLQRLGSAALLPLPPRAMFEGRPIFWQISEQALLALVAAAYGRAGRLGPLEAPETYLRDMDQQGIDLCFLYPTYALLALTIETLDPALATAVARAYNAWVHDFCAQAPERLRGVGVVSFHDPAQLCAELHRIVDYGWRSVMVRPNPLRGRLLGDPAYEAFWAECARLDVSVAVHEGTHSHGPAAGSERFQSRFALHACTHPMEHMMGFLSLLESGVLERHPGLRFAFLESGGGWVPYWLWRLDDEFALLKGEVREHVRMKPSEYFRRQCFVVVEPSEPYLPDLFRHIGEGSILFGSDFPHVDHAEGVLDALFALRSQLPEGALEKVLWANPARFYGVSGAR